MTMERFTCVRAGGSGLYGCWVVTEQKIHLRTQAASSVASDALPSFGGLMRERTKARHDAARGRGVRFGRPRKLNPRAEKTGSQLIS
jgi:hypothetical protein